jgi:hypothetical protein
MRRLIFLGRQYKANDFPMRPPRTGLEIILKAVFYNDFAPLALRIGNLMTSRTNTCARPNGGGPGRDFPERFAH